MTTAPPKQFTSYTAGKPVTLSSRSTGTASSKPSNGSGGAFSRSATNKTHSDRPATPTKNQSGPDRFTRSPSPFQRQHTAPNGGVASSEGRPGTVVLSAAPSVNVTSALLSEHEHHGEARSIAVVSGRVWCADKERIVIRNVTNAGVHHIIHKTPDMGFIWVLERVKNHIWVGCSDGHIRVLNKNTYEESHDLFCHSGGVYCLLHVAGRVYSGSADFQLLQWNAKTGELIRKFPSAATAVRCLCALEHGRIAAGSDDGGIRVYEVSTGNLLQEWGAHTTSVRAMTYIPSTDRLWTAGEEGKLKIWTSHTGVNVQTLTGHAGTVTTLYNFSGCVWSGGVDGVIVVWDAMSGILIERMRQHNGYITCLAQVQKADVATVWTVASDKMLKLWTCQCVPLLDAEDQAKGDLEELARRITELEDANLTLNQQNQHLQAEAGTLRAQNMQMHRTVERQGPSDVSKQIIQDLEAAKGRATAEAELLRSKAELADDISLRLREREETIVRGELERAALEDRLHRANSSVVQLQVALEESQERSRDLEKVKEEFKRLQSEFTELKSLENRRLHVMNQAGYTDIESMVRRMRVVEDDLRIAKESLQTARPIRSLPRDSASPPNGNVSTELSPQQSSRIKDAEIEALREELDTMRSGQDYNIKLLLELQGKCEALETTISKQRDELFVRDQELAQQSKMIQRMVEKSGGTQDGVFAVSPISPVRGERTPDRGESQSADPFLRTASALTTAAVLRDINTQCNTVRNTVTSLRDEARTKQAKGQGVQDFIVVKELQHVSGLMSKLCTYVQNALGEISPELGSDVVSQQPGGSSAKRTPSNNNLGSRSNSPRTASNVKRSATPPSVAHTLTSSARVQRVPSVPSTAFGRTPTPVKVTRVSPMRTGSPVLAAKKPTTVTVKRV